MTRPRVGFRYVRRVSQPFTRGYQRALAGGVDPLEALAHETDLLLGLEDSSPHVAEMSPVVAAVAGKVPAHSKDWAGVAQTTRPAAQETETPMRIETVSHAARRRSHTEDQAA